MTAPPGPSQLISANNPARTRIKICGVTSVEIALAAAEAGADAIGLVRVPDSPRYVEAERATEIMLALPPLVAAVGVYRDNYLSLRNDSDAWEDEPPVDWVQLHGDEDEACCEQITSTVIRAIPLNEQQIRRWDRCDYVDALLIEGNAPPGSGGVWDYSRLACIMQSLTKPVFLAGGLTPDNVGEAIRTVRPYAVDVSSGVESSRGVKDPALIRAFCDEVRAADLQEGRTT
jgi:phosphoribosylanthranilate isomerase